MPKVAASQYRATEIYIVAYLLLQGFRATRHEFDENGRGILYFKRTAALDAAIADYHNACGVCGICFAEIGNAIAESRRQLLDGRIAKRL